jgi:diguanylate cyclase (GGDEF)-like protein/PAS domain S-box-containing protein
VSSAVGGGHGRGRRDHITRRPYHRRGKEPILDGASEQPEVIAATLSAGDGPSAALRLLVERIGAVVWSADVDGRLTSFAAPSASGEEAEPKEVLSTSAHRKAMAGEPSRYEIAWRGRSYEAHVQPLRDEDGQVIGSVGCALDVTAAKDADDQARQALSLLRASLDSTNDGILVVDREGRIVSFNRRFVRMWRIPPAILHARDDAGALAHVVGQLKRPEEFLAKVRELYSHPEAESLDTLEFKDGRVFERYSTPQRLDGAPIGRVWSFRDVTDRRRAEDFLRKAQRMTQAGSWTRDYESGQVAWSDELFAIFGIPPRQPAPAFDEFLDMVHPDERAQVGSTVEAALHHGDPFDLEFRIRRPDGQVRVLHARGEFDRNDAGEPVRLLGTAQDITERREAEKALRESEERYRLLFERNLAGVYRTALDGRILDCNEAFARIFGYESRDELLAMNVAEVYFRPTDRDDFLARLREQKTLTNEEGCLRRRDGAPVWILENVTIHEEEDGEPAVLEGTLIDITARKRAEEQIAFQAYHDPLTGLPNRALFNDRLSVALLQAHRTRQPLAVMFLDLDHFKRINDTLGHTIGDRLLQRTAERARALIREGDTVARIAGDEFTLLLPGIGRAADAAAIAHKVLSAIAQPFKIEGHELYVTTSVGIALYPGDGEDAETLVRGADSAMYRAKELGRNTYQLCTQEMMTTARERLALENRLRPALQRGEFLLHYQPLADLRTGSLVGVEALLRWRQPDGSLMAAGEFIPVAESSGVISSLGEWVLHTACQQVKVWQEAGYPNLRVAVNLSPRQFQRHDFRQTVARVLENTGLAPQFLELEITESVAIDYGELTVPVLRDLRSMGVGISADDFGTGQSSLSYLKHLPLTAVKIDQSFVRDITVDEDDEALVKAVIGMAHSLRLKVIAEGVETQEQLDFLKAQGCEEMQGYLFSRPLPAAELKGKLRRRLLG